MSLDRLTFVSSHPYQADNVINQFFQTPDSPVDKRWYQAPEICEDPTTLNQLER